MKQKLDGYTVTQEGKLTILKENRNFFAMLFLFLFMSVWMTGWTCGCGMILMGLFTDFAWFNLLFGIPFFAAWFAGLAVLIGSVIHRRRIILGDQQVEIVDTVLIPFSKSKVPFKEISQLKVQEDESSFRLVLKSSGKDVNVFQHFKRPKVEAVRDFLIERIPNSALVEEETETSIPKIAQTRNVEPKNNGWRFEHGLGNETLMINKGSFEVGPAFVSLFACLFWNGIVSVFSIDVIDKWAKGNWHEALFLSPFVLIGLGILIFAMAVWFDPLRKTTYSFSQREITWRHTYLGIGPSKSWNLVGPVTMKIQIDTMMEEISDGTDFELAFSDGNKDLMKISPLTLAEAEWLSTQIHAKQRKYKMDPKITPTLDEDQDALESNDRQRTPNQ